MEGDEFDWLLVRGTIGRPRSGPQFDHTVNETGKGNYAFIGAGHPGNKAWAVSDGFKPTRGRCMSFWYRMAGRETGTLNILLRTSGEFLHNSLT